MQPGKIIRDFRKKKGLTLEEFGREIDYSIGYLSNVETGRLEPSRELIKKLEHVFGLTWDSLYKGSEPKQKEFIARIEVTERDKMMINHHEGHDWPDRFVPIPIAKGKISGGNPRLVREDPEGVAIIYRDWAHSPENFTAVWMKGQSMERTIPDGSLVGIDHSHKDINDLNGKIVALRKNGDSTIKRLKIISKDLALGMPDNPDSKEVVVLRGEEIDTAIIGKVAWWWGRQE